MWTPSHGWIWIPTFGTEALTRETSECSVTLPISKSALLRCPTAHFSLVQQRTTPLFNGALLCHIHHSRPMQACFQGAVAPGARRRGLVRRAAAPEQ
jgi:hypothetical protein